MPERQSVTIHYRRFVDSNNILAGRTLEDLINDAMIHVADGGQLRENWTRRTRLLPPEQQDTHFINLFGDGAGHFFGDLTHFTRGHMQALLERADDTPSLNVSQMPAPEGREYLHSVMYWLARGNHVLVLQSRSVGTKQLEEYLTWLLHDRCSLIADEEGIVLEMVFDTDEVGGDLEDISSIVIGGSPLAPPPAPVDGGGEQAAARDVEEYRGLERKHAWAARMREVLRAVMNSEADVEELLNSVPDGADLDVVVQIGYKLRRREVSRAPMQRALRNLPDGDIRAVSKTGRQTGRDVRLSYPARVLKEGSLLDPADVERALREAYDSFINNGKIQA